MKLWHFPSRYLRSLAAEATSSNINQIDEADLPGEDDSLLQSNWDHWEASNLFGVGQRTASAGRWISDESESSDLSVEGGGCYQSGVAQSLGMRIAELQSIGTSCSTTSSSSSDPEDATANRRSRRVRQRARVINRASCENIPSRISGLARSTEAVTSSSENFQVSPIGASPQNATLVPQAETVTEQESSYSSCAQSCQSLATARSSSLCEECAKKNPTTSHQETPMDRNWNDWDVTDSISPHQVSPGNPVRFQPATCSTPLHELMHGERAPGMSVSPTPGSPLAKVWRDLEEMLDQVNAVLQPQRRSPSRRTLEDTEANPERSQIGTAACVPS